MYDRHLDDFIKVAELGSFAKAADALYLSPTALIKHVNLLERDLGVRLLDRTNHGARLTPAGELIYRTALEIVSKSNAAVSDARRLAYGRQDVVRLASSVMRSTTRIRQRWARVARQHASLRLDLVQVEDTVRALPVLLDGVGTAFDVLPLVRPSSTKDWFPGCAVREAYVSPASFLVPLGHPLADAPVIGFDELEGERVYLTARGYTDAADDIRDSIAARGLGINVVDIPPYDMASINDAARTGGVVATCAEFADVHPAFRCVPCREEFPYSVCLIFPARCGAPVREFVDAVTGAAGPSGEPA